MQFKQIASCQTGLRQVTMVSGHQSNTTHEWDHFSTPSNEKWQKNITNHLKQKPAWTIRLSTRIGWTMTPFTLSGTKFPLGSENLLDSLEAAWKDLSNQPNIVNFSWELRELWIEIQRFPFLLAITHFLLPKSFYEQHQFHIPPLNWPY